MYKNARLYQQLIHTSCTMLKTCNYDVSNNRDDEDLIIHIKRNHSNTNTCKYHRMQKCSIPKDRALTN